MLIRNWRRVLLRAAPFEDSMSTHVKSSRCTDRTMIQTNSISGGLPVKKQDGQKTKTEIVNLMLRDNRVTAGFRTALFDATRREGLSVNEFVLRAAAEKLRASGRDFPGVFSSGDFTKTDIRSA